MSDSETTEPPMEPKVRLARLSGKATAGLGTVLAHSATPLERA